MSLALVLQISIAIMGSLSAILLGMGERHPLLPTVAVVVAGCAVYFNDIRGWVRLSESGANMACLAAAAIAVWDLSRLGRDGQLLAAANLLVYLQFILLFQNKSIRRYWMLVLLSLMQVAVAAALGLELSFGLLMLAYLVVALTSLTLFCVEREIARYSQASVRPTRTLPPPSSAALPPRSKRLLAMFRPARGAGRVAAIGSASIGATVVGGDAPLSWSFVRLVLGMTASTLAVALALFFLSPRLEQDSWARRGGRGTAITGIPETVSLADVGTIYESPEAVMRVQFFGPNHGFYPLREPPLFRGFHLTDYHDNRWRQSGDTQPGPLWTKDLNSYSKDEVRQQIDAEPSQSNVLFHVPAIPTFSLVGRGLLWDESQQKIIRTGSFRTQRSQYVLSSSGFDEGRQLRYVPATWLDDGHQFAYTDFSHSLTRVRELSRQIVAGVDPEDRMAQIEALNNYLIDARRFAYTLRPRRRDKNIDAVEDFLFNSRQGHCEYFASALTLMLRSAKIPARVVIGYKGGEFNSYGNFYQVRQLHAHAWVEAFIEAEDLPPNIVALPGEWRFGAWYTIDPTPISTADGIVATSKVRFLGMRQMADYARFLWSSYVMGMDARRQQQSVYSLPVATAKRLANPQTWRGAMDRLAVLLIPGHDPAGGGRVYLRLAVLGAVLIGGGVLVTRVLRKRWPALRHRFSRTRRPTPSAPRVETLLYGRLEKALARYDFHRPDGQTPREFALAAGSLLAGSRTTQHVAQLPLGVVESCYRLRFAGRGLDKLELQTLEQSLARLEAALAPADSSQGSKRE
jgi:hypothetical protein